MFYASEDSIDDLMRAVFRQLLSGRGNHQVRSQKGDSTEIFGALLELKNPRARLSRSFYRARAFSPLGELFWYLAGDQNIDFIKHYIPTYSRYSNDGIIAKGAYGPRIFGLGAEKKQLGKSEWDRVIRTLRKRQGSRNAVIQIYSNKDSTARNKDKPCTCTIQFAVRNSRLLMHTHMRSNDAYLGLPHDVFTFTMFQEIAARELGVGLGKYTHSVTSLHLYHDRAATKGIPANNSTTQAKKYYEEGLHEFVPMPEMPQGDPWPSIEIVKKAEKEIRLGNIEYQVSSDLSPYWQDIIQLFKIHKTLESIRTSENEFEDKAPLLRNIVHAMRSMNSVYELYVRDRLDKKFPFTRDLFEHANQRKN